MLLCVAGIPSGHARTVVFNDRLSRRPRVHHQVTVRLDADPFGLTDQVGQRALEANAVHDQVLPHWLDP